MQVLTENLWLCDDCVQAVLNDDFTGLDYHYTPEDAARRAKDIAQGLADLGPNLVTDWSPEGVQEYECVNCGHHFTQHGSAWDSTTEETVAICPACHSESWVYRESGYDPFSRSACDCCGETLHGARHRFAILGD